MLDSTSTEPIYLQIASWLENEILIDELTAHEKMYSQYQLAEIFQVNPATAGKALTQLLDNELLYKKRGVGTFITEHAKERIQMERKKTVFKQLVEQLVEQANLLQIDLSVMQNEIQKQYNERRGSLDQN